MEKAGTSIFAPSISNNNSNSLGSSSTDNSQSSTNQLHEQQETTLVAPLFDSSLIDSVTREQRNDKEPFDDFCYLPRNIFDKSDANNINADNLTGIIASNSAAVVESKDAEKGSLTVHQRLKYFWSQFKLYGRYNEPMMLFVIVASLLSTFIDTYGLTRGKLQLRKQPAPSRFFAPKSPVLDSFDGNDFVHPHQLSAKGEVVFLMYYAPWSTPCTEAKFHFDRLARIMQIRRDSLSSQVRFLAVNCWEPSGQCQKLYKMNSYPVLALQSTAYFQAQRFIFYNHIISADYIYRFLSNALSPLRLFASVEQVKRFQIKFPAKMLILAGFDLRLTDDRLLYESFYTTAFKCLEVDPLREKLMFGAVIDVGLVEKLGLSSKNASGPIARIFNRFLNEPKLYVSNRTNNYDAENLFKWAFSFNINQTVQSFVVKQMRDEQLYHTLTNYRATVVLFAPRLPVYGLRLESGVGAAFSKLAKLFYDCPSSSMKSSQSDDQSQVADRSTNSESAVCWVDWEPECSDLPITGTIINNDQCSANKLKIEPANFNANAATPESACERDNQHISYRYLTGFDPQDSITTQKCQQVALAKLLGYPKYKKELFSLRDTRTDLDFQGLGCRTNVTFAFLNVDSHHYGFLAQNYGVTLNEDKMGLALLDSELDSVFVLDSESFSGGLVETFAQKFKEFLIDYVGQKLKRNLKSEPERRAGDSISCQPWRLCVERVTAAGFNRQVIQSKKDVILMLSARWCGMCHHLYYVFQTAALYFRSMSSDLRFASIDADRNELPWQYTVDSYPTIIYFPANRSGDRSSFPKSLPFNVPNLISFILSKLTWPQRLKFAARLCHSNACRLTQIRKSQRLAARLRRKLSGLLWQWREKFYLWTWADKDPDFGPTVEPMMKNLWAKIGRLIVKIRTLNRLKFDLSFV